MRGCACAGRQDHFQGNRTPHTDPNSRGAFVGLTLAHGRGHLFRSLMEGVAFGTRLIIDTMKMRGFVPVDITVAGGATNSPLWLQARILLFLTTPHSRSGVASTLIRPSELTVTTDYLKLELYIYITYN